MCNTCNTIFNFGRSNGCGCNACSTVNTSGCGNGCGNGCGCCPLFSWLFGNGSYQRVCRDCNGCLRVINSGCNSCGWNACGYNYCNVSAPTTTNNTSCNAFDDDDDGYTSGRSGCGCARSVRSGCNGCYRSVNSGCNCGCNA